MLERLGLGIELQLEDNFTPQVNNALGSFDRLQSGAESMQQNISRSLSNLQNLMLSGFSLVTIGDSFQNAGKAILGTFKKFGEELISTNDKFDTIKSQLLTVYGSANETKKALDWATNFSIKTPFDIEGTTRAMQMMKSQGLDVTKEFKNAKGEAKSFLEYMGDFATRNMSSTGGFTGMAYAISNAIGGDFSSIRKRFDLAKADADMLKEAMNTGGITKFAEEFTNLSDKLTPNAMKNMLGTWSQITAEMKDTWDVFLWKVGEAGAFDPIKKTLKTVSIALAGLITDSNIKVLSNVVQDLWKPINSIVVGITKLVGWMFKFADAHPKIARMALGFMAINGVLLTVTGTIMKLSGGALILVTSLVSAYANFALLKTLNVGMEFASVAGGLGSIVSWLGLAGAGVGAFALAWHNNFMGIRDKGTTAIKQLKEAWANSDFYFNKDYANKFSNKSLTARLNMKVDDSNREEVLNSYFGGLTKRIAQFRALGMGVMKTIFGKKDKEGNTVFSKEDKEILSGTGMLKSVLIIDSLRQRLGAFFKGFGEGIGTAIEMGRQFMNIVLTPIKALFEAVGLQIKPIGDYLKNLFGFSEVPMSKDKAEQQIASWNRIGKAIGAVAGVLLGFKLIKGISSVISKPFNSLFKSLMGVQGAMLKVNSLFGLFKGKKALELETKVNNDSKANMSNTVDTSIKKEKMTLMQYLFGKGEDKRYNSDVAKEYFDAHTRVANVPKSQREGKYNRVYPNQMDESYYKFKLADDGIDTNRLYTDRKPSFWKKAFGDTYYTKNDKGEMSKVGNFGGYFNTPKYDEQLRLATQRFTGNGNTIDRGTPKDYIRDAFSIKSLRSHIPNTDSQVGNVNMFNKGLLSDTKAIQDREAYIRKNAYKLAGVDGRKFNNPVNNPLAPKYIQQPVYEKVIDTKTGKWETVPKMMFGEQVTQKVINPKWQQKEDAKSNLIKNLLANDPILNAEKAKHKAKLAVGEQAVFKEDRSKLREALFGQRFYKIDKDKDGNLYENTVSRRGGIFRNPENDKKYKEEGDTSFAGRVKKLPKQLANSPTVQYLTRPVRFIVKNVGKYLGSIWDLHKEMAKSAYDFAKEKGKNFKDKTLRFLTQKVVQPIKRIVTAKIDSFIVKVHDTIDKVKGFGNKTLDFVNQTVVQPVKRFVTTHINSFIVKTKDTINRVKGFGSKILAPINQRVVQPIKRIITTRITNIKLGASKLKDKLFKGVNNLKGSKILKPIITKVIQPIKFKLSYMTYGAKENYSKLKGALKNEMSLFKKHILTPISNKALKPINNKIVQPIKNKIITPMKNFVEKPSFQKAKSALGKGTSKLKDSLSVPMNYVNKQRKRLGLGSIGLRSRDNGDGTRKDGLIRKTGRALFARSELDTNTGKRTGGGLFSRAGRGAVSVGRGARTVGRGLGTVGRGVSRGAGMLGRGAMGAMGVMGGALSLGGMAFGAMKNKGGGDAIKGLKAYQAEIKKINFNSMFNKLKTQGGQAWKILGQIGKDVWAKLKPELPRIMGEAFQGIKGLAKLAWTWIKSDGINLFMNLAGQAMKLVGKAFSWLGDNAGKIFGGIAQFVIGTVIPKLIMGVVSLGKFIVTHIPQILSTVVKIAGGIFEGLLTIVKGIFSGIANFLWNAISGALRGIGSVVISALGGALRAVLPAPLEAPVLKALGIHHKGLWMSQDEHPAIIRKDETVLPPGISKKFNDIFNSSDTKQDAKVVSDKPSKVDNSIRIDKVEIVVQADKMSRADAREQAKLILEELKKMKNENIIRQYA